jgi:hypothetical protein
MLSTRKIAFQCYLLIMDYTLWLELVLRRDADHEEKEEGEGSQEGEETSSAERADEVQSCSCEYCRHAPLRSRWTANDGAIRKVYGPQGPKMT